MPKYVCMIGREKLNVSPSTSVTIMRNICWSYILRRGCIELKRETNGKQSLNIPMLLTISPSLSCYENLSNNGMITLKHCRWVQYGDIVPREALEWDGLPSSFVLEIKLSISRKTHLFSWTFVQPLLIREGCYRKEFQNIFQPTSHEVNWQLLRRNKWWAWLISVKMGSDVLESFLSGRAPNILSTSLVRATDEANLKDGGFDQRTLEGADYSTMIWTMR